MRIQLDSNQIDSTQLGGVGQTGATGGSGSGASRVGAGSYGGGDSIQISGASTALNRLAADRAAQIEQLTSAVQNGSYQVSSQLVGGAIVDHALA